MITRLCEYEIISVNTYNCLTLPQKIRLYAHSFVDEYTIYLNQKNENEKNLLVCVYKLCKEYVFVEKKPEKLKTNKKTTKKNNISPYICTYIYVFICVHIIHK